jgi:hypothetical protein
MSRTNPYKKKRRTASQTLLIYGEGLSEEIFLKHLKCLYAYDSNIAVTIRKGKGGDAISVVIDAANTPGAFDRKVVILDNDKGNMEMSKARQEAKKRNIILFENTPCLEAMLLLVLENDRTFNNKTSDWCKKEFESKYIDKKKRAEPSEYEKIFPKALLDKKRSKVAELNQLILFMEGKS